MPVQSHESVWTFDGTLPPKLLMARYGQPILMRHYNGLPIDPARPTAGSGCTPSARTNTTATTRRKATASPTRSSFPGQFYDYRWPIQLAGYDSINTSRRPIRAPLSRARDGEKLWVNDGASPGREGPAWTAASTSAATGARP
jgi:hypothetical protein